MKKASRFISIAALAAVVVLASVSLSCSSSSDDGPGKNKYLPNKFSVGIPKSLQKEASSSDLKGAARSVSGRSLSTAYTIMTDDIDDVAYIFSWAAIYFVVSDEIISKNGYVPQADSHGTVQLTVTQDLIDRVAAITGDMNIAGVNMQAYLGKAVPFEDFTYATTTTSPYNLLVSFTFSPPDGSSAMDIKIQWSSDMKKVRYGVVVPTGDAEDGITYLDNEFTYYDDLQGVAFVVYQENTDGDIVHSLLKIRANDAGGAYVSDNLKDPPVSITSQTLLSYATDSGGILKDQDGTYIFDAKGGAATSPSYSGKLDEATAKIAEIPDLAPVTK